MRGGTTHFLFVCVWKARKIVKGQNGNKRVAVWVRGNLCEILALTFCFGWKCSLQTLLLTAMGRLGEQFEEISRPTSRLVSFVCLLKNVAKTKPTCPYAHRTKQKQIAQSTRTSANKHNHTKPAKIQIIPTAIPDKTKSR